ncbi:MAG: hypothetical protein OEY45_08295 [Gammaproteobacteria bacterium]|nr:hypothetical protein [Gammaproteobacteria bacterium]
MKYRSLIVVLLLGLAGNVYAEQHEDAASESDDDRIACIEAAIAEEIDAGEPYDNYVEACYQEKLKQRAATDKSPDSNQ